MILTGRRFQSDGYEIGPAPRPEVSTCEQCGLPIWRDRAEPGTWGSVSDDRRWYSLTASNVSASCDAAVYVGDPYLRQNVHVPVAAT